MKAYYDLHLHTCLSPCGDDDMTPNNLVNMAKICGLDVIAITDHNSCKNCEACMKVGDKIGIKVIAGMELCTSEEVHVVCLFPSLEKAMKFDEYVSNNSLKIKNKEEIFGKQLIMNEKDEVIGSEENLLLMASMISLDEVSELVANLGGISYPAHIDRDSYSIISNLGDFSKELDFCAYEVYNKERKEELENSFEVLKSKIAVSSSDAHYLENMRDRQNFFELESISAQAVISYLKNNGG